MDGHSSVNFLNGPAAVSYCSCAAAVAFILTAAVFPAYIAWLKRKQIEQFIREEGPQSHAAKAKTPTMGGLCFIVTSTIVSAGALIVLCRQHMLPVAAEVEILGSPSFAQNSYFYLAGVVIVVAALCGLVGFADDFAKVTSRSNKGLSAKARLMIEFALGGLLGLCMYAFHWPGSMFAETSLRMAPGTLATVVDFVYLFGLIPFLVAATTNALNLHDGMDGLAGGTSIQVFIVLTILLLQFGQLPLALVAGSLVGALGGFLIYNRYPAQVFMGDTGSLFIGGMLAALISASGLVLWFIPLVAIYIAETISVIIQVVYFKLTKDYQPEKPMSKPALILLKLTKRLPGEGKRFFRMAPLHHHFEAVGADKGVAEWQVVAYFWVAQLIICACVLFSYFQIVALHS